MTIQPCTPPHKLHRWDDAEGIEVNANNRHGLYQRGVPVRCSHCGRERSEVYAEGGEWIRAAARQPDAARAG